MTPFLLCFGLGFSAWPFARSLQARGWRVVGTCRDGARAERLSRQGIECVVFADEHPLDRRLVQAASHCLVSIPPGDDNEDDVVLRQHGDDLAAGPPAWIGYLSSTAVYGDAGGAWVDEDSPCAPTSLRSRRRLEAEHQWRSFASRSGVPLGIFRLGGIYGPGRSVIEGLRAGRLRRIITAGQVFSRIHVDDSARCLRAACLSCLAGLYNLCDDEPAPAQDVIAHACELLALPLPAAVAFDQADLSPMARSFYADNRRVSNRHIKTVLSLTLSYPSYRQGLAAILSGDRGRADYFPRDLLEN